MTTALSFQGIEAEVAPLIDARGNGRRRATLHARREGVGYMVQRSHDLYAIDTCPILVPALAKAPEIAHAIWQSVGDCDVSFTATAHRPRHRRPHREARDGLAADALRAAAEGSRAPRPQRRAGAAERAADGPHGQGHRRAPDRQLPPGDRSCRVDARRPRRRGRSPAAKRSPISSAAPAPSRCASPRPQGSRRSTATSRRSRRWRRPSATRRG